MSVRHIHARPGEYIAVHRNGGYRPYKPSRGGGNGGSNSGEGIVILFVVGIILFWFFADEILTLILILVLTALIIGILVLIGWLGWTYRKWLWQRLYNCCMAVWHGICYALAFVCGRRTAANSIPQTPCTKQAQRPQTIASCQSPKRSADYGKIIQKF